MSRYPRSHRTGHGDIHLCRVAGLDGRSVPAHGCRRWDPLQRQACSGESSVFAGRCYRKHCRKGRESASEASADGGAPGGPLPALSPWGWGHGDRTLEGASAAVRAGLARSSSAGDLGAVRREAATSVCSQSPSSGRSQRREVAGGLVHPAVVGEGARTRAPVGHGTGRLRTATSEAAGMPSAGALALATPEPARRCIEG